MKMSRTPTVELLLRDATETRSCAYLALNATRLVVLTGAGSSFSAKNKSPTDLAAPAMSDLWDAVEKTVTPDEFKKIFSLLPKATSFGKNIEKLLTQCKLYVELFDGPDKDLFRNSLRKLKTQ